MLWNHATLFNSIFFSSFHHFHFQVEKITIWMTHSKYERDFYLHSFLPFSLNINQIKKESQTKNISSVTILISTKMVDFSKLTGLTDFSYFILERLNFEDLRHQDHNKPNQPTKQTKPSKPAKRKPNKRNQRLQSII